MLLLLKYEGAKSQAEFNQNTITSLRLLNETGSNVRFSRLDYKKDYYDARSLKSILIFTEHNLTMNGLDPIPTEMRVES